MWLICRCERPHPRAEFPFTDVDGHRLQCFITDQPDRHIAALDVLHRQHAEVEDRVKTLKATRRRASTVPVLSGKRRLVPARPAGPRHSRLNTAADHRERANDLRTQAAARPHPARRGKLTHRARCTTLHLPANWPWAGAIPHAVKRWMPSPPSAQHRAASEHPSRTSPDPALDAAHKQGPGSSISAKPPIGELRTRHGQASRHHQPGISPRPKIGSP
jgi:hypothetical protein